MAFIESEGARAINKLNGENFIPWKFKLEMGLAYVDLSGIVDQFEVAPHLNT